MTLVGSKMEYRRLRAPRAHGEFFIDPSPHEVKNIVVGNVEQSQQTQESIADRPFYEWTASARQEAYHLARKYTSQYSDVELPEKTPQRLFFTGHQPQLFHPGVWLKNFALDKLTDMHDAVGINLLVDNDILKNTSLPVPGGSLQKPIIRSILFDSTSESIPFEERKIRDRAVFSSFAQRVKQQLAPFIKDPIIQNFWPMVLDATTNRENIGQCFSQARHLLEISWGTRTLEIPLSRLCDTSSFFQFAGYILLRMSRFREIYNTSLAQYRKVNKVRSRFHPVPDLTEQHGRHEAPFWIWTATDPRRRRLFVFHRAGEMILSDRGKIEITISTSGKDSLETTTEQLLRLTRQGVKLRPRALITTMYTRLVLSDLFIHGIGGAKYDQLTDLLIQRFFDRESPRFLTISATALLPIQRNSVVEDDLRRADRYLRELRYHPEEHLHHDVPQEAVNLVKQKRNWIAKNLPRGHRKQRHLEITHVNDALQEYIAEKREMLLDQRNQVANELRREKIFTSREYSFCLFPETTLRDWLLDLTAHVS